MNIQFIFQQLLIEYIHSESAQHLTDFIGMPSILNSMLLTIDSKWSEFLFCYDFISFSIFIELMEEITENNTKYIKFDDKLNYFIYYAFY